MTSHKTVGLIIPKIWQCNQLFFCDWGKYKHLNNLASIVSFVPAPYHAMTGESWWNNKWQNIPPHTQSDHHKSHTW